jgi:salicylate hydroxylase
MPSHVLIAGGGIAGLASALALARRGHRIDLLEQAETFGEVGAGIQLGPNVTRRLQVLGLLERVQAVAAVPAVLRVRSADDGGELARLLLGDAVRQRYGAPYLCVHRADLQALLLAAASEAGTSLNTGACIAMVATRGDEVVGVSTVDHRVWEGDALVGADGLWGSVRTQVTDDARPPRITGHTAWRALVAQAALPPAARSQRIEVWLGPRLHAVSYPVRGGEWLNVVVLAESAPAGDARDWDQAGTIEALERATGRMGSALQALLEAMPAWRAWTLCDRPALTGPHQMARGRIALVGDAAHPMLPYLAQGAGMAIEDALALAEALGEGGADGLPVALARYAQARWRRNAHVQTRARRNGEIFHAVGPMRAARNTALRLAGARLLDAPWLYAG